MATTTGSNNVIHQLTPRQFSLFKMAYSIFRHHAINILSFQKEQKNYVENWIGNVLNEMKQILTISGEDRYFIRLSDLNSVKHKVAEMAGWYDVNSKEQIYLLWKAHQTVVDLIELLVAEILYDQSVLCDDPENYRTTLES